MTQITLKGNPINTNAELPRVGDSAKNFTLVKNDLSTVTLEDFGSQRKVLTIFPSLDTPVCAASVRKFNEEAASLDNTIVLNISADLPFAQARFCGAEGIEKAITLSTLRSTFPKDYGLEIIDGPLAGLCSRAIVVLDENNKVIYTEQVPEIVEEPNYDAVISSLK